MKNSNDAIEHRRLDDIVPGDSQDVADQHVLQVFSFASGLAHGQDRGCRRYRISDSDERLLRNMAAARPGKSENGRTYKRKSQAEPVSALSVRVHSNQNGDGGAQRGNLRQRQIHKDYAPLHNVHSQIGVNARENEAGQERPKQELQDLHVSPWPTGSLFSATQYRNRTVQSSLSPVFRLRQKVNTPALSRQWRPQCCSESSYQSKARPAPTCSSHVS